MKTKPDYRYLCDKETNGVTACGLILRYAGIIAFLLMISINVDKVLRGFGL